MLKPDVILTQPLHCDFPLFRHQLHKYRKYYNKIIVSFHEGNVGYDYRDFLTRVLSADDVICVDPPIPTGDIDWRHNCIHAALNVDPHQTPQGIDMNAEPHVISENILFLEQDFIMYDDFEKCLQTLTETSDTIIGEILGASGDYCGTPGCNGTPGRLHPAFLFVPRYLVTEQSDFGADIGPKATHDHFGAFANVILKSDVPFKDLTEIAVPESWLHLAGLTHNYTILNARNMGDGHRGSTNGIFYRPEEFKEYNERNLQLEIEMEPKFLELIKRGANI
tara:strand:+ start:457 stop:1293 length:837 start_codon:yes stop_codon:yes gene_type:complete